MNPTSGTFQEGPFGSLHIDDNVKDALWSCSVHNSTQALLGIPLVGNSFSVDMIRRGRLLFFS